MTRGQIVLLDNDGLYTSIEFNGEMHMNNYGKEVIDGLNAVKNRKDYEVLINEFNAKNFQYEGPLLEQLVSTDDEGSDSEIDYYFDMSEYYFEKWNSDYLYIKNISCLKQKIRARDADCDIWLEPGQIIVLNFGRFINDTGNYKNPICEKSLSQRAYDHFEGLGWIVREHHNQDYFEIENYSPSGEDLCETLYKDRPILEQLTELADDFDPEAHAVMWYNTSGKGAPTSLRDLLKDADAIQQMYDDLVAKFSE